MNNKPRKAGNPYFYKGMKKVPMSGRKKGTRNKFTNLKEAFLSTFEAVGGANGLAKWASTNQSNRKSFYAMLSKMLPKELIVANPQDSPEQLPFIVKIENSQTK